MSEPQAPRTASEVDGEIKSFLDATVSLFRKLSKSNNRPRIQWEPEGDVATVTWARNLHAEFYRDMRDRVVAYVAIPGGRRQFNTPKKAAEALLILLEGARPGLRVGASQMSDLRKQLIRIAHVNPELRPHILPLLKEAQVKVARGVVLRDPECMLSMIDPRSNVSKFYEMEIVPLGRASRAKKTTEHRTDTSGDGVVLMRRWGRLTDSGKTGRVDSMNDIFDNMRVAWLGYNAIYRAKIKKGYEDVIRRGEYPVGLGGAGFGWGGQAICKIIPEVRAFRDELERMEAYLKNLRGRLRPIAKEDSTMAGRLEGFIGQLTLDVESAEQYIEKQLATCDERR